MSALIHPTAIVDEGAVVGSGTHVWHWTHICAGATLGTDCSLGQGVYVGGGASIGNRVKIQNHVSVYDAVHLEDEVFCGPSVVFTNVINPRSAIPRKAEYKTTRVMQGATLGANATIICGVTIGRHAFVAAGAVVTHDVPDHALVMGTPARQSGWVSRAGLRLAFTGNLAHCAQTGEIYELRDGRCHAVH
jgi:UDP-2-acetamido-3-amino-2,3-dideoxy-glucuronate N-acetyltransferase